MIKNKKVFIHIPIVNENVLGDVLSLLPKNKRIVSLH